MSAHTPEPWISEVHSDGKDGGEAMTRRRFDPLAAGLVIGITLAIVLILVGNNGWL